MYTLLLSAALFSAAYLLNIATITVGYHRGLAHRAVALHPALRRAVVVGGIWVTGLDPKAWVVMHRLHHIHSDKPGDPHSPRKVGISGILKEQLKGYKRTLLGLILKDPKYMKHATDLDFEVSWVNSRQMSWLPYTLHAVVGAALALALWSPLCGLAYFLGMMSHPIQGGMVNALGHAVGGRRFDTPDDARNNGVVAWLVAGEGYQNNHHHAPASARFSVGRGELDWGYGMCRVLEAVGLLRIERKLLLPREGAPVVTASEG